MSEMIQRMAKAMTDEIFTSKWEDLSPEYHEHFKKLARAAIGAMREPTEAMGAAGYARGWNDGPNEIWRVMIDEALK